MDIFEQKIGKKIEDMTLDEFNRFWEMKYGNDNKKKEMKKRAKDEKCRVDLQVKNFFACITDDTDHNFYPLLQAELRKVLQDVMLPYYEEGKQRYVYNIDFFHLPNMQSKRLIEFLKEKSKKHF